MTFVFSHWLLGNVGKAKMLSSSRSIESGNGKILQYWRKMIFFGLCVFVSVCVFVHSEYSLKANAKL